MKTIKILVINGPNLNMLGKREPEIYGFDTLETINKELIDFCSIESESNKNLWDNNKIELSFFQSNIEGEIVNIIQSADADGIIINPAAYTHTSVAILDALRARNLPAVEVHLSNVNSREEYRKTSFVSDYALGVVSGFKKDSYKLALLGLYKRLAEGDKK